MAGRHAVPPPPNPTLSPPPSPSARATFTGRFRCFAGALTPPVPPVPLVERHSQLIDFDRVSPTILHTFMSAHVLTEFGGGGYKSSGWDWQSCPRSLGPTRSGCKVAIHAATPGREGSADLEIMTWPPLLRFTLTVSAHDLISFVPAAVSESSQP